MAWIGLITLATFVLAWLGTTAGQHVTATSFQWIAPAVLAGLLLRHRQFIRASSWVAILCGLALADFARAPQLSAALCMSLSTLVGVSIVLYRFVKREGISSLRSPRAVVHALSTALLASASSAAAAVVLSQWAATPQLTLDTLSTQILAQTLSYSVILPPMLLAPRRWHWFRRSDRRPWHLLRPQDRDVRKALLPASLLALSLAASFTLGGPGAIVFPVPALLYCALAYRQITTAWLTLAAAMILTMGLSPGIGPLQTGAPSQALLSFLLGILLLAISPLLMSSMLASRSDLILSLHKALDHDGLTQALSRQAFLRGAEKQLQQIPAPSHGHALMMLDIDFFKQFNDRYGHAAGDQVLHRFAQAIRHNIRPQDLFGRLGGEEFALMLPDISIEELAATAERLRTAIQSLGIRLDTGDRVQISVSIGTMHDSLAPKADLLTLLAYADQAMYQAKRSGRNQVHQYDI